MVVIGLSHHNAKVEVREKLAIPEEQWSQASGALCDQYEAVAEAAVLSTCNRFELYLSGQNQYECMRAAMDFLYERAGGTLDQATLRRNLFMLTGETSLPYSFVRILFKLRYNTALVELSLIFTFSYLD